EEDLLVGPVVVGGGGEVLRGDLDTAQAHVAAARFTTEIAPDAFDVADRELPTDPVVDIPGSDRHCRDAISGRLRSARRWVRRWPPGPGTLGRRLTSDQ